MFQYGAHLIQDPTQCVYYKYHLSSTKARRITFGHNEKKQHQKNNKVADL